MTPDEQAALLERAQCLVDFVRHMDYDLGIDAVMKALSARSPQAEALIAKWRSEASGYRLRDDDAQDECGVLVSRHADELEQALGERRPPAPDVAALIAELRAKITWWRGEADCQRSEGSGEFADGMSTCADDVDTILNAALWERSRTEAAPQIGWQPIETAPKDGSILLLTDGRWIRTGSFATRANVWSIDMTVITPTMMVMPINPPTQWAALPASTSGAPDGGGR